jgi:hypothetical protein
VNASFPTGDDALDLWDAVAPFTVLDSVYELEHSAPAHAGRGGVEIGVTRVRAAASTPGRRFTRSPGCGTFGFARAGATTPG